MSGFGSQGFVQTGHGSPKDDVEKLLASDFDRGVRHCGGPIGSELARSLVIADIENELGNGSSRNSAP